VAHSTGDRLGPYEIRSVLGKGGMGEVYRSHDHRLKRDVAIKTSPERFNERFEREARAIAALNHPNICTLYDVGPDYLVMELVEGASPKGPLPTNEALRIAGQIASALEAAHEKSIVHRDLKPANVKVTPSGMVKVLDFGLAKTTQGALPDAPTITLALTEEGLAVGTPAYMSPEQAQGKPVDNRTDIWSFGVVLYELLTGQRPFQGDSAQSILAAVLTMEPDLENVPVRVRRLLRACLRKDPQERLAHIADWRLLVDDERPSSPAEPQEVRSKSKASSVPWAIAMVGLAIGVAGLLLQFSSTGETRQVVRFSVPVPGGRGSDVMAAVSPDGKNIAISAAEEGRFRLRVRPVGDLEARLLPGADGARYPFWSPDSQQIGFFADGKLKTIFATGGEPATVTNVESTILGSAWSSQRVIVFSQSRALYKVSETGGSPERLYQSDSEILYQPVFLPDGRHFIYVSDGVYLGSLEGSAPIPLLPDRTKTVYAPEGYLLFSRQGRLNAQPFDFKTLKLSGTATPITRESVANNLLAPVLSVGDGGALAYQTLGPEQLVWVDRTGAVKEKVGPPQEWSNFRLSPNQSRVAFDFAMTLGDPSARVVAVFEFSRGTSELLTLLGKGALVPVFSPDGIQVAFTSRRTGRFNPYLVSPTKPEQLVTDMGLNGGFPMDWSPDGKNLLYWGDEDLWIVPVDGRTKPYTFAKSDAGETHGVFSPDGKWIAYASDISGRFEVYLQAFPEQPGNRYTISSQGGRSPAWRRDSNELFFVAGNGMLTAVPVALSGSGVQLGAATELFPANASNFLRAYEPSLDGQRFLVSTPAGGNASITVVLHWPLLLEDKPENK
jgi:Tol biopolymer transport system component